MTNVYGQSTENTITQHRREVWRKTYRLHYREHKKAGATDEAADFNAAHAAREAVMKAMDEE